jgi:hypothetical protein
VYRQPQSKIVRSLTEGLGPKTSCWLVLAMTALVSTSCRCTALTAVAVKAPGSGLVASRRFAAKYRLHYQVISHKRALWYSVRFDVFTAVAMKNVVFWDIKLQFVLRRRHITSPLESSAC